MGSGAARELSGPDGELPVLDVALEAKLTAALNGLDAVDTEFADSREVERIAVLAKQWNDRCQDVEQHLRLIGKVLIKTHQLSFDIGSSGGGLAQKPFMEDLRLKFPKLHFTLDEEGTVTAVADTEIYGTCHESELDFDFCMTMVVEWSAASARKLSGR